MLKKYSKLFKPMINANVCFRECINCRKFFKLIVLLPVLLMIFKFLSIPLTENDVESLETGLLLGRLEHVGDGTRLVQLLVDVVHDFLKNKKIDIL